EGPVPVRLEHPDVHAGRDDVDVAAGVGERADAVVLVGGADADHPLVGGRVEDRVAELLLVARGGDDRDAAGPGVGHRLPLRLAVVGPAEGQVDDPGTGVGGVVDALGDVGVPAVALVVQRLDRQDPDRLVVAGDLDAVVRTGGDDAGDVGAVAVVVHPAAVGRHEVVEARYDAAHQVGDRGLHAGVDDRDEHR